MDVPEVEAGAPGAEADAPDVEAAAPAGDGSRDRERRDDARLLARALDGDSGAFRELFDRKHRGVYLTAYQILGDGAAAEEVVQETFLVLWRQGDRYDPRYALDTWLRRIAANRAIDRWRRSGRERRVHRRVTEVRGDARGSGSDPTTAGAGDVGADEDGVRLTAAASGGSGSFGSPTSELGWREVQAIWDELAELLPPAQRAAFVLREIDGLDTAEVALALECSASTVRSHLSLARKTLRRALEERYPEYLPPGLR